MSVPLLLPFDAAGSLPRPLSAAARAALGLATGVGRGVLVFRAGFRVAPGGALTGLIGLGLVVVAFLLQVASRASLAIPPPPRLPESVGLSEWFRGGQWMALLTGVGLLARSV